MNTTELFGKHFNGLHYDDITPERIEKYAIEFAKHHVEKALKAVKDNICLEGLDHDYYSREISKEIDPHSEIYEYGGLIRVYEPSIDEAYLLENIK